jgi:hypothetical protein
MKLKGDFKHIARRIMVAIDKPNIMLAIES